MDFQTALNRTASYYSPYPGPGETTFNLCLGVADVFRGYGCKKTGVIGIAIGSDGGTYLGLSPDLQREVLPDRSWVSALKDDLRKALEVEFFVCLKVEDDIVQNVTWNRGCAEKKILSHMRSHSLTIHEISVIAYPDEQFAEGLGPANIVLAAADGVYIAPCQSCVQVAQSFPAW